AFEGSLPELTEQQAREEALLVGRRLPEECGQHFASPCRGAFAFDGAQTLQLAVRLGYGQSGDSRGLGSAKLPHGGGAKTKAAARKVAGKPRDARFTFVLAELAQAGSEHANFLETAPRCGQRIGRSCERLELHRRRLSATPRADH